MISINNFGRAGRLGNQIFQYALLYSIHSNKGYDIHLPLNYDCQFWKCFDVTNPKLHLFNKSNPYTICTEKNGSCNFDERLLNQPDNTVFCGYFQSYKYFDEYKEGLIKSLVFKDNIINEGNAELNKYGENLIGLHIRRGDYLEREDLWGNLIKCNYFENATKDIDTNETVLVFTDDNNFAKDYFSNKKNFKIIEKDEYVSLYMLTKCKKHIISNSSFAWMGAYLSGVENITYPDPWWPSTHKAPNNVQKNINKPSWNGVKVNYV